MITLIRPSRYSASRTSEYSGRSIDTKPIHVENGSKFEEIDTGRVYYYDAENIQWLEGKRNIWSH